MRTRRNISITVFLLMGVAFTAQAGEVGQPDTGAPLRDPQIAYDAAGETYYMTGTTRVNSLDPRYADLQNNDGVRLWKSRDLKEWEEVGLVWDLSKTGGRDARKGGWQAHLRTVPGRPEKEWSRGVTAPELHFVKGDWWIIFALNDQDIGLLKSASGKPEGPYQEIGRISNRFLGGDGSLFEDSPSAGSGKDGEVYMVWGGGYIAPMKEDMTDIAEEPKSLQIAIEGYPSQKPAPNQMGERGAFVFKDGDTYHYVYAAWNLRDGAGHFDTFICEADSLFGPYSKPRLLIPDGGQAMVFRDSDGVLKVTYAEKDRATIHLLSGNPKNGRDSQ